MTVHLKLYDKASSLRGDGSRNFVHPADVSGRFDRRRKWTFGGLIALLAALPWLQLGGHPAVFLDFEQRSFYLFGATFNVVTHVIESGPASYIVHAIAGGIICLIFKLIGDLFTPVVRRIGVRITRWLEGGID